MDGHTKIYKRIIGAIILIGLAVYTFIAVFSYNLYQITPNSYTISSFPKSNLAGAIGSFISNYLLQFFGLGSFLLIVVIFFAGISVIMQHLSNKRVYAGLFLFFIVSLIFLNLILPVTIYNKDVISGGGLIGAGLSYWLDKWFGEIGTILIIVLAFLISLPLIFSKGTIKRFLIFTGYISGIVKAAVLNIGKIRRIPHFIAGFISNIELRIEKKRGLKKRRAAFLSNKEIFGETDETIIKIKDKDRHDREQKMLPSAEGFVKGKQVYFDFIEDRANKIPPISILPSKDKAQTAAQKPDKLSLLMNSRLIEKKLLDFGVRGKVTGINPGPVITIYEFEPSSGIKIGKIQSLSEDLTMALKSKSVRITGVVEGKSAVGIEVPNNSREAVYFSELLNSKEFMDSSSYLSFILGRDTMGGNVVFDLAKCPHLLVAGSTGAGKSVFLNTLIISILFKAAYNEVNFIMIDPKRLELAFYEGIPHLICDVIYDPKKASVALNWAVQEMGLRYRKMQETTAKNIKQYNDLVKKAGGGQMPYIVIIIDELSDLMLISSKDVETSIMRLSQMARACGIHLVIATQRPSVNVITGIIKANMPSRIAFLVSSKVDSRTILDANGAEELLGSGDMLFLPPGQSKLIRIHGAYINEEEIKKVINFIKGKEFISQKDDSLINELEKVNNFDKITNDELYDELYNDVLNVVMDMETVSISFIQRRFRVGFNRAARLYEKMQSEGILTKKGRIIR